MQQVRSRNATGTNDVDARVVPRPPTDPNRPIRRAGSRSRLLLQLNSVTSDPGAEDDAGCTKSGSLTDGNYILFCIIAVQYVWNSWN